MQGKGQLLLKAKTMIVQNIQSRTVFTRGDLGRFISLSPNVEHSTDHLVTLQTLTETRYTSWIEEPDRGMFVPKVPATIKSVWDITSVPPSGFISDRQIYPIQGSEQRYACPDCSGAGEVSVVCYSCNGSGREICSNCNGAGRRACYSCNGSGTTRGFEGRLERCSSCDGTGTRICTSCDGHGGRVCYSCSGTGRVIKTCWRCAGVGRLIKYCAIVCEFKPHEFREVISRWNLPFKQLNSAKESQVWEIPVSANSPLNLQGHAMEVRNAANSLVQQMMGLQRSDTRLVRSVLSIKAVPVAHINFRLHGVPGDAWLLGKDFDRIYLPKVPLTFKTWWKLKDWVSVWLTVVCLVGYGFFALLILSLLRSPHPTSAHVFGLVASASVWVVCGLILLARRLIAGLAVFAVIIASLAYLTYLVQRGMLP